MATSKKKRVVIILEGGLIQCVAADDPELKLYIFDWDIEESVTLTSDELELFDLPYPPDGKGPKEVDRYLREARKRLEKLKVRVKETECEKPREDEERYPRTEGGQ